jgi:hypothetical protein
MSHESSSGSSDMCHRPAARCRLRPPGWPASCPACPVQGTRQRRSGRAEKPDCDSEPLTGDGEPICMLCLWPLSSRTGGPSSRTPRCTVNYLWYGLLPINWFELSQLQPCVRPGHQMRGWPTGPSHLRLRPGVSTTGRAGSRRIHPGQIPGHNFRWGAITVTTQPGRRLATPPAGCVPGTDRDSVRHCRTPLPAWAPASAGMTDRDLACSQLPRNRVHIIL